MVDRVYANKAEFDRLAENDKCANYGVYCAHIEALAENEERNTVRHAEEEIRVWREEPDPDDLRS
jgi:hypothetical protein